MKPQAFPLAIGLPTGEQSAHLAAAACYRIKNRSLAFGATWSTLSGSKSLSTDAAEEAANLGVDYMALRDTKGQYALFCFDSHATPRPGRAFPWLSAAALLADKITSSNWAGAWQLPDGRWWTVTVFRFKIQPAGDRIHETEEEARDFLQTRLSTDTWRPVYAPKRWGIPATTDSSSSLEDVLGTWTFLPPVISDHKIGPAISRRADWLWKAVKIGGITAAAFAIAIGFQYFQQWRSAPPAVVAVGPPVPGPPPHYVPGAASLTACLRASAAAWPTKVLAPGWTPLGFVCEGQTLTMTTAANQGTPIRLARMVNPLLMPDPTADGKATATVRLPPAAAPVDKLPVSTEDDLRRFFGLYCDTPHLGARWTAQRELPPAKAAGDQAANAPRVIPRFAVVKWKLEIAAPPEVWGPTLRRLPDWALLRAVYDDGIGKPVKQVVSGAGVARDDTAVKFQWVIEGVSHVAP